METIDLVCLCQRYDIIGMWGAGFRARYPWIRMLRPEEVTDPGAVRHALAFSPGPEAFDPYPNLEIVHGAGAGVDALLAHSGLRPDLMLTRVVNPEQARMMAAGSGTCSSISIQVTMSNPCACFVAKYSSVATW